MMHIHEVVRHIHQVVMHIHEVVMNIQELVMNIHEVVMNKKRLLWTFDVNCQWKFCSLLTVELNHLFCNYRIILSSWKRRCVG